MYKYAKDGVTIFSVLDTRRPKQSGLYPVKIQVVFRRIQKYYGTGKELSSEDWAKLPETKARKLIEIRQSIENSFSVIKNILIDLSEREGFSFDALNLRLGRAANDTLNIAFQAKIDSLKEEDRIGSMFYYNGVLKLIERFGGNKIAFESVTVDWLKRYEKFLLQEHSRTTVGMHMRAIRAIINEARKTGVIKESQYPFGKGRYEIQTGEGRKIALTLQQVGKVIRYSDGNETTERYRDLWFFSYLCNGINMADLVKLKYSNIQDGEICFVRQKTERTTKSVKEIRAIVNPEMEAIIKRWGNEPKPDNYIFPYLTGKETELQRKLITNDLTKRINKRLSIIGENLGIGKVTTYVARHSYATVLKRSGANIAYISESLGHNDLKTTENYLASFEKEERQKNASLLTNFGN